MKAISMKAQAMPKIALWSLIRTAIETNKISIGITGATAAYLGCILSADVVMFAGAILAMLSVNPSIKKGNEK
ncbi:hypothetical protein HDR70_01990 [bacterium]|nr:hypothetical protein [bacterium]